MSTSFADELLSDLEEQQGVEEQQIVEADRNPNGRQPQLSNGGNGHNGASADLPRGDDDGWGDLQDDGEEDRERMEEDLVGLDGDEEEGSEADMDTANDRDQGLRKFVNGNRNAVRPAEEMRAEDVDAMDLRPEAVDSVTGICTLMQSGQMRDALADIEHYSTLDKPDIEGVLEDSPEYQLIVKANNLAVDVDNEIMVAHKVRRKWSVLRLMATLISSFLPFSPQFIRQHYQPRFPELESLIPNPWEFVQAVQAIGNQDNLAKAKLDGILPHGTVVVISMQAAVTKGRKLSAEAWKRVQEACELVFELEDARRKILQYVESRMAIIAPSLSKVVGSRVATKLLGVAGGLTALTKIPACNLMLLGASNKAVPGLSTAFSGRHRGFIVQAPLIENTPEDYHRQAIRIVSAKALLAARVDAGGSDRHGVYGAKLVQELEKKLEKLQEPPPAKMVKALPVPKEGGNKTRRGGRRARKLKERNGMSDLRKMQNRVRFGEAEEEAGAFDETVGLGMISSKGDNGRLRAQAASNATKAQMSKRNTQRIQAIQQGSAARRLEAYGAGSGVSETMAGPSGDTSGTASSLAFTPVQGIELIDPSRQRKVDEANAKWFKEGTFSLAPGASSRSSLPGLKTESGTTMAPSQLPPNKKHKVA